MTTLLRYDLTTDPFPLQASTTAGNANTATLTVVGSNPNPSSPVTLQGVSITLPVGPDAADLTATPPVAPVAPAGWTLHDTKPSAGKVEYVFYPQAGQGAVGKQGLAFVFNGVSVNTQPGTAEIVVKEGSAGDPTKGLYATKFPNGWGSVAFWVDPPNVPYQGATTLHWSGPSGATYTIEYALDGEVVNVPAEGDPPLGAQGQYPAQGAPPLTLDRTTVFTLNVNETIAGQPYQAQEQKTVTIDVPAPRITSFSAELTSADFGADPLTVTITLSWTAENTDELLIDSVHTFDGDQARHGSFAVQRTYEPSFTFTATAEGLPGYAGGAAIAQTPTLALPPPVIDLYTVVYDKAMQSNTLNTLVFTWSVEHAASLHMAQTAYSYARDFAGRLFGRVALSTDASPSLYTLTAEGFQTRTATPTPGGVAAHTGLSLMASDWRGFGGFTESADACRTCRYMNGPDIQLYGWDTVLVAPLAEANRFLATARWPVPFTYTDTPDQISASGQFGPWQMTAGGAGVLLNMLIPVVSGTMSSPLSPSPLDLRGATALVEVSLRAVPYLTQGRPTPPGGTTGNFVSAISFSSPPGSDWSVIETAVVKSIIESTLNASLGAFANLFGIFNPTLNSTACPPWLMATNGAYLYVEAPSAGTGFFVALATTTSKSPGAMALDQHLLSLQQASFIINNALHS